MTALDGEVARSLAEGELTTQNVEHDYEEKRTIGERLSDGLTETAGTTS